MIKKELVERRKNGDGNGKTLTTPTHHTTNPHGTSQDQTRIELSTTDPQWLYGLLETKSDT